MSSTSLSRSIVILTGLGAPISLYQQLADDLRSALPKQDIHIINWWEHEDFGQEILAKTIRNTQTILIAHSGGGVIALQALMQSPELVKRAILLDTHFLHKIPSLTIDAMLETMLQHDNPEIKNRILEAYEPTIKNSASFFRSFHYALGWVNSSFKECLTSIQKMPAHTVFHIGFTDSSYQALDSQHIIQNQALWNPYKVDTESMPMSHFDLVIPTQAKRVASGIIKWLCLT